MQNQTSLKHYKDNGYITSPKYLNENQIQILNSKIDDLVKYFNDPNLMHDDSTFFRENNTDKIKQIQYLHRRDPIFQDLVNQLETLAKTYTESENLKVLNVQLFEKHPQISKPTRSHQDNAYFKVHPANAITFWLALDDIDQENGALYYAPKTHLTPTRKHVRYHRDTTFRVRSGVPGLSLCLKEHPSETDILMNVKKGDLLAHHCNLVHRAEKNNSTNRRRRAIGVVFIPKECKKDNRLVQHHEDMLREDIELQKIKNPSLYKELKTNFAYLFNKNLLK